MAKHFDIHNHNMWRKLNVYVQHWNTVIFKKSMINMGISLYNKVPDQIRLRENCNSFNDLKSFLLQHSFYSIPHNFGYSVSFDYWIFACGITYCILYLLLYTVHLWCVHSMYAVKYYSIVDLCMICYSNIYLFTCSVSGGCITKYGFLEQNKFNWIEHVLSCIVASCCTRLTFNIK
jgi:hypothetical protein